MFRYLLSIYFILVYTSILQSTEHYYCKNVIPNLLNLKNTEIIDLHEDKSGILWIATPNGLFQFDGSEIRQYKNPARDANGLENIKAVTSIYSDDNIYLWLGTNRGVAKFNKVTKKWINYHDKTKINVVSGDRNNIFRDKHNRLWLYGNMGGLFLYNEKKDSFINIISSDITGLQFTAVYDGDNKIYFTGIKGEIFEYSIKNHRYKKLNCPESMTFLFSGKKQITTLEFFHGILFAGTWGSGLIAYDIKNNVFSQFRWNNKHSVPEYVNIVTDLGLENKRGKVLSLIVAGEGGVINVSFDPGTMKFNTIKIIFSEPMNCVTAGNRYFWLGSFYSGVYRLENVEHLIANTIFIDSKEITYFNQLKNGNIITSSGKGALMIYNSNGNLIKNIPNLSNNKNTYEGKISWFGCENPYTGDILAASFDGFIEYNFSNDNIKFYGKELDDELRKIGKKITHLMPISKDRIIISIWKKGACLYNKGTGKVEQIIVSQGVVRNIVEIFPSRYLILGEGIAGLFNCENNSYRKLNLPTDNLYYFDALKYDNLIVLATSNGLWYLNDKTFQVVLNIPVEKKLTDYNIKRIVADSGKRLWLETDKGLVVFDYASGLINNVSQIYNYFSGVKNLNIINSKKLSVFNNNHLLILNTDNYNFILPPKVVITNYAKSMDYYTFPVGVNDIEFKLGVVNLSYPTGKKIDFKLSGIQEKWVSEYEGNSVYFHNLPPGNYTFIVRHSESRLFPEKYERFHFIVQLPFYKTSWFPALSGIIIIVFLAGLLLLYYRSKYKYNKLKSISEINKIKSVEAERNRIAQDFHDDFGSQLSAIILHLNFINSNPETNRGNLERVLEMAKELTIKLKEIIWLTSGKYDKVSKFVDYLINYSDQILSPLQINVNLNVELNNYDAFLDGFKRRMIFLSYKEVLSNIIKHSDAENVYIIFSLDNMFFTIEIKDDGIGFDIDKYDQMEELEKGNGLKNIQDRMGSIGGQFYKSGAAGKGAVFILKVKILNDGFILD